LGLRVEVARSCAGGISANKQMISVITSNQTTNVRSPLVGESQRQGEFPTNANDHFVNEATGVY
jgi:hypothetical protein